MIQAIPVHIMHIRLRQLCNQVGRSHIAVVAEKAVILLFKVIHKPEFIPCIVWVMAVFAAVLGNIKISGVTPGICTVSIPGGGRIAVR
jgi:predicted anti-sigma-YlaC factor YlaD